MRRKISNPFTLGSITSRTTASTVSVARSSRPSLPLAASTISSPPSRNAIRHSTRTPGSSSITSIRMRPSPLDLFPLSVGGAPAFAYGAVGPSPVPPYGRRASAARSVRFEADAGGMVVERLSADRHAHDVREVRIHGQAAFGAREPLVSHRIGIGTSAGSLDSPSWWTDRAVASRDDGRCDPGLRGVWRQARVRRRDGMARVVPEVGAERPTHSRHWSPTRRATRACSPDVRGFKTPRSVSDSRWRSDSAATPRPTSELPRSRRSPTPGRSTLGS